MVKMTKKLSKEMDYYIERFDSINELLTTINSRKENSVFCDTYLHSQGNDFRFTGTYNYKEAVNLLVNGWDKHLGQVKNELRIGNVKGRTTSTRVKTDFVGYAPCVPRAIQGLPDAMFNSQRVTKKAPTVSLVYCAEVCHKVKTDTIINTGIKLLKMVNILENMGIKVQLDLSFAVGAQERSINSNRQICGVKICMKRYRDKLDIKKMIFPLVHPSMLRRIFFKYLETAPSITNDYFASGYGTPIQYIENSEYRKEFFNIIADKSNNEYVFTFEDLRSDRVTPESKLIECGLMKK